MTEDVAGLPDTYPQRFRVVWREKKTEKEYKKSFTSGRAFRVMDAVQGSTNGGSETQEKIETNVVVDNSDDGGEKRKREEGEDNCGDIPLPDNRQAEAGATKEGGEKVVVLHAQEESGASGGRDGEWQTVRKKRNNNPRRQRWQLFHCRCCSNPTACTCCRCYLTAEKSFFNSTQDREKSLLVHPYNFSPNTVAAAKEEGEEEDESDTEATQKK